MFFIGSILTNEPRRVWVFITPRIWQNKSNLFRRWRDYEFKRYLE